MSKNIFMTGGAGFIGSHTAQALAARGDRVTIVDAFDFGYDAKHKENNAALLEKYPNVQMVRGDIRDSALLHRLFSNEKPDVVVHLAARAGVRPSLEDPVSYSDINITGTIRLLEIIQKHDVPHLVFASSSSIYGARKQGPFRESDVVDIPASAYAATKKAGELFCANWNYLYGLHATCLRFFTVYGPRQRPEMAISLFTDRIRKGIPITMFGDGSSLRDYTFVQDIVQGVLRAIDHPIGYEVLNLGNGSPVRLDTLIHTIADVVGKEAIIQKLPDQPGDVPMTFADIQKAKSQIGYNPKTTLKEGITQFYHWLSEYDPV
ncbi:MAG: NAD-dependent epimerase/dehydratase family protein [Myxococcota bacterium]|nr:NAD-dependent epimerase/dehydratase family protein [Myxococcota bacterium]